VVPIGDRQRQRGLPGRRRAKNGDDQRVHRTRART
jgi:hypothetical protein